VVAARIGRVAAVVVVITVAFIAVVAILTQVMPGPRTRTDYLVIGTVGTFVSLLVVFVIWSRGVAELLFRRRKR
jgi:hypothetical protein